MIGLDLPVTSSWSASSEMLAWSNLYNDFPHVPRMLSAAYVWLSDKGLEKYAPTRAYYRRGATEGAYVMRTSIEFRESPTPMNSWVCVVFSQVLLRKATENEIRLTRQLDSGWPDPPRHGRDYGFDVGLAQWMCERPRHQPKDYKAHQVYLLAWPETEEPWSLVNEKLEEKSMLVPVKSILDPSSPAAQHDDRWAYI